MYNRHRAKIKELWGDRWFLRSDDDACSEVALLSNHLE